MARTRAEGFGPEVIRRALLGTYSLSAGYYDAFYGQAQRVRAAIQELRQGLRASRRAGLADEPDRCVRRRCPDLGSARHVPVGHLQHPGEHGGPPRHIRACRPRRGGPAHRVPGDGASLARETMYQVAAEVERLAGFEISPRALEGAA